MINQHARIGYVISSRASSIMQALHCALQPQLRTVYRSVKPYRTKAMAIQRRVIPVSGAETEILSLAAHANPALLQVLVVPGNPGNANYYTSLMHSIHHALGGKAHVLSCSHAGHDLGDHNTGNEVWSLEDQIQHKADLLCHHLLLPGQPPLVVVAHSIGSYMAIHAVSRYEAAKLPNSSITCSKHQLHNTPHTVVDVRVHADGSTHQKHPIIQTSPVRALAANGHVLGRPPILKVVALMPFLQADFKKQPVQRWLRRCARHYRIMSFLARVLSALPLVIRMALVNWWTARTMSSEAVKLTCMLLHPHTILNNFYMAHTEFKQLKQPFDWSLLEALGPRVHVAACPEDPWMSHEQYQHMHKQVPSLSSSWHPELEHAFCVSDRQVSAVSQLVAKMVKPHLENSVASNDTPQHTRNPLQQAVQPNAVENTTGEEATGSGETSVAVLASKL